MRWRRRLESWNGVGEDCRIWARKESPSSFGGGGHVPANNSLKSALPPASSEGPTIVFKVFLVDIIPRRLRLLRCDSRSFRVLQDVTCIGFKNCSIENTTDAVDVELLGRTGKFVLSRLSSKLKLSLTADIAGPPSYKTKDETLFRGLICLLSLLVSR
jgi:hypothetical protein